MPQAQPYRKAAARRQTAALRSMQKGRPSFLRNPADAKRFQDASFEDSGFYDAGTTGTADVTFDRLVLSTGLLPRDI